MVYTVTFNPSLDYVVNVDDFKLGMTNRTSKELMLPGGKGTNVSIVLKNLGVESTALGFAAGFIGEEIVKRLAEVGVHTDFIMLDEGCSRINVKLVSIDGTEINGMGPQIDSVRIDQLMEKLSKLTREDTLVLAGSIPASMPADIYQKIMERLQSTGVRIVVDATRDLLMNVLPYQPFLIKPNHHELGEIFGVELKEHKDVVEYARRLQEKGAKNVLVSMGGKGAVLLAEDGTVIAGTTAPGNVINTVGAGDSMVAGFLAGYMEQGDYEFAFKTGLAAGGASAFSTGFATKEGVDELRRTAQIERI